MFLKILSKITNLSALKLMSYKNYYKIAIYTLQGYINENLENKLFCKFSKIDFKNTIKKNWNSVLNRKT